MRTNINKTLHLLGLWLAVSGCGSSGGSEDSSTGTPGTSGATTGTSTGSTASPTTGDATTEEPGTSVAPTSSTTVDPTSTSSATATTTTSGDTSTGDIHDTDSSGDSGGGSSSTTGGVEPAMSFFVSSTGSTTADLGGLEGADQRCQDLADAVGAGDKTWRAYLSVEKGPGDQPVHAKDRIGEGPWYNAKLVMLAADLTDLHTNVEGDPELFLDENGEKVNGQWQDSPKPNEHDILTGSNKDGTLLPGKTCADWTSDDATLFAQVGHSDGLGPMMSDAPQYRSWNSVHENGGCHDTAPKGGAGKVYCFAID